LNCTKGKIEAHSEGADKGSEFILRLPIIAAPPLHARIVNMHEQTGTKDECRRILVVDDNAAFAKTFSSALELLGYEVEVAHDGTSAIALAQSFVPEITLLDIGMPGMNGFESVQKTT